MLIRCRLTCVCDLHSLAQPLLQILNLETPAICEFAIHALAILVSRTGFCFMCAVSRPYWVLVAIAKKS